MARRRITYESRPAGRIVLWGIIGFVLVYAGLTLLDPLKLDAATGSEYWTEDLLYNWEGKAKTALSAGFLFASVRSFIFDQKHITRPSSGIKGLIVTAVFYAAAYLVLIHRGTGKISVLDNDLSVTVFCAAAMLVFLFCSMLRKMPVWVSLLCNLTAFIFCFAYFYTLYPIPKVTGWAYTLSETVKPALLPVLWYANVTFKPVGLMNTVCLMAISGISVLWHFAVLVSRKKR